MKKTILITGASSGFGKACAYTFGQQKHSLILAARRKERLDRIQRNLGASCRCHTISLDVRSKDGVRTALDSLPSDLQDIDVLVNNAGLALGLEPAHKTDLEDWETMVDTNIKGLMYCTRAILPGMVERDRGHIINLGSIAGEYPYPGSNVYGATKAFVKQFSLNLRSDLSGTAVRVTDIEPGMAESEFSIVRFKGDKTKADNVYAGTKPLLPKDIAEIISWVVSLPPHVNINRLEVMPVSQSWAMFQIARESKE